MPNSERRGRFSEHPLFSSLKEKPFTASASFVGYVGPSNSKDTLTLFASLENPSDSVEVSLADILHSEDVPETTLPFGAKMIWVRDRAKIVRRRIATAGRTADAQKRHVVEMRQGRLKMVMVQRRMLREECSTCVSA